MIVEVKQYLDRKMANFVSVLFYAPFMGVMFSGICVRLSVVPFIRPSVRRTVRPASGYSFSSR